MLKIWHYLNYKLHFYLCVQWKTTAFLDVYGHFWKFQDFSQSCKGYFSLNDFDIPMRPVREDQRL